MGRETPSEGLGRQESLSLSVTSGQGFVWYSCLSPLFLLSEFSLLSLSPRLQFFSYPFFFSPSLFCLSALGFLGLPSSRKPVSWAHREPMVPERLPLCGCLPLKDLLLVSSVLASLSVEFKDIVALGTSCLNPFALSLSSG